MKLFYFLIIVLIIYFIATRINVVHITTLPETQQKELNKKSKFKSRLSDIYIEQDQSGETVPKEVEPSNTTSYFVGKNTPQIEHFTASEEKLLDNESVYSGSQFNSRNYKRDYYDLTPTDVCSKLALPNMNDLFILLRSEYIDTTYAQNKYKFNSINLPVTNRYPNKNTIILDKKYTSAIKADIMSWNDLFPKYYDLNEKLIIVKDIKLIFIMETEFEFVIQAIVKLSYRHKPMFFKVQYHGSVNKTDDILNGQSDTQYELKLIELTPVAESEFTSQPNPNNQAEQSTFVSMDQQLKYVDKINKMHKEETNIYG